MLRTAAVADGAGVVARARRAILFFVAAAGAADERALAIGEQIGCARRWLEDEGFLARTKVGGVAGIYRRVPPAAGITTTAEERNSRTTTAEERNSRSSIVCDGSTTMIGSAFLGTNVRVSRSFGGSFGL
jgi:hypothetical protein